MDTAWFMNRNDAEVIRKKIQGDPIGIVFNKGQEVGCGSGRCGGREGCDQDILLCKRRIKKKKGKM